MITLPPLSLYVHMPWCVRKCPYCDFNSHRAPAELPTADYVNALLEDLEHDLGVTAERLIVSVFMGGGTPSLFSPEEINRLLGGICARVRCVDDLEVTLEANPATIERGAFAEYAAAGVNRVSLGVQSFNDSALRRLGRIHSAAEVQRAVEELHAARLINFNLDLMYALPEQDVMAAVQDIEIAIASAPAHISHYELTLEPGTVFHRRPPTLPVAEIAWQMQEQAQARLASAGYGQYEVSAYARSGSRCRHNLNYWQFGDYLGLGAGAHGKYTVANGIVRTIRQKQPRAYLKASAAARVQLQAVEPDTRSFEFMLNALRLNEGFESSMFEERTGMALRSIARPIATATAAGLLQPSVRGWKPTALGRRFLNDLQTMFLPEASPVSYASQ